MQSRRNFIGNVATGLAGTLAAGNALGANQRIRLGIIGAGARGTELLQQALSCENVECVGAADVYTRRLEDVAKIAPNAETYLDYRRLLDRPDIDAVLIATPQHLHAEHFIASLDSGKHVYQEKTMAFTVDHAKRMRTAFLKDAGRHTVQIGHQGTSGGAMQDAIRFNRPELIGKITAIRGQMYRNTPHGKPQWARPAYPDMTPEHIDWRSFLGDAAPVEFDANRYINWRFFWDYSGGNVFENMCHQLSFWYKVLDLSIPRAVTMAGGTYLWKDGREVPDTMNVAMEHEEELLFTWDSGFGNDHPRVSEDVLGDKGTISHTPQTLKYYPQKVNRKDGNEMTGVTRGHPNAHMRNFFDSIRGAAQPNCPFDVGFRVSVACRMAVESYRQGRCVRWDPVKEELV
jgi:predicted dehydrogenase